jgi:hypothetical protein
MGRNTLYSLKNGRANFDFTPRDPRDRGEIKS